MPKVISVAMILGPSTPIEGLGKVQFTLSNGTPMTISEVLYSHMSSRTLVSFKDIRANEYDIETTHKICVGFFYT